MTGAVLLDAQPGDVLAVWTGGKFAENMIRAGEALDGDPAVANHVIYVTNRDKLGRLMGIQGQPGGVGRTDCTRYLSDPRTRVNRAQPRDMAQLVKANAAAAQVLGWPYDWVGGIAADVARDLHLEHLAGMLDHLWSWPTATGEVPGHFVCSSLAAWVYREVGWAHPGIGHEREVQPSAWWDWSDRQLWTP